MKKRLTRRLGVALVAGALMLSAAAGFAPDADAAWSSSGSVQMSSFSVTWCRNC